MSAARFVDDPWLRLRWVAPLALVLTVAAQMGLVSLLERAPSSPPAARPLHVQIVELPAEIIHTPPPPPARLIEPPRPARPKAPPPQPERVPQPVAPPPPRSEPPPQAPPEPVPQTGVDLPKEPAAAAPLSREAAAPAATAVMPAPRAPDPGGAAPDRTNTTAAAPSPPSTPQGTPGGTGFGGDKGGARAIYKPLPEIPESLRHQAIDVVAVARFQVAANGSAQVELIEPTADPELNRALLASLRRWRFFPGMQNGKPIPSTVDIRIPISVR